MLQSTDRTPVKPDAVRVTPNTLPEIPEPAEPRAASRSAQAIPNAWQNNAYLLYWQFRD